MSLSVEVLSAVERIAADDPPGAIRDQPPQGPQRGRRLSGRARLPVRSPSHRGLTAGARRPRAAPGHDRQARRRPEDDAEGALRRHLLAAESASLRRQEAPTGLALPPRYP